MIKLKQRRERGLTMIEVAMALVLAAIIVAGLVAYMANARHKLDLRNQAQQLAPWINAADQYVAKNRAQWLDKVANDPQHKQVYYQANAEDLRQAGLVPASLKAPTLNGQALWLMIKLVPISTAAEDEKLATNWRVEGMLYSWQGTAIPDSDLGQLLTLLGSRAGAVTAREPNEIKGTAGAWQAKVSDWYTYVRPGHFAVLIGDAVSSTGSSTPSGSWLARKEVANHPELNRMETDIDMNWHDLNNVHAINNINSWDDASRLTLLSQSGGGKNYLNTSLYFHPTLSTWGQQTRADDQNSASYSYMELKNGGNLWMETGLGKQADYKGFTAINPNSTSFRMNESAINMWVGTQYQNGRDRFTFDIRDSSVLTIRDRERVPCSGYFHVPTNLADCVSSSMPGVLIGTSSDPAYLQVYGNVLAKGLYASSDRRLKKDITRLPNALAQIERLNGYHFVWRKDNTPSVGVIAQEVQKVYPELVSSNPTTHTLAVNYPALVAPLIEAVKQLHQLFIKLEAQFKSLLATQNNQQAEIDQLKAQLQAQQREMIQLKFSLKQPLSRSERALCGAACAAH